MCHVCVTDGDCVRLALSAAGIAAATHTMLIIYSFTTVALGVSAGQDFTSWTTLPALMSACVSAAACARAAAPVESKHTTAGDHGDISENKQEAWQRKCLHEQAERQQQGNTREEGQTACSNRSVLILL